MQVGVEKSPAQMLYHLKFVSIRHGGGDYSYDPVDINKVGL